MTTKQALGKLLLASAEACMAAHLSADVPPNLAGAIAHLSKVHDEAAEVFAADTDPA